MLFFSQTLSKLVTRRKNPSGGDIGEDVLPVGSLDATYIVNVYDGDVQTAHLENLHIITNITFNEGGKWQRLYLSQETKEKPLNLFGKATTYGTLDEFVSDDNAPGIILGNGKEGQYLDPSNIAAVGTYLSSDGGWSWKRLKDGASSFAMADFGGLLLLVDDGVLTSKIYYTWNSGKDLIACDILGTSFYVNSIFSVPGKASQSFFMFVSQDLTKGSPSFLLTVDFSQLHKSQCRSPERAGNPDSDYEIWSPTETYGGKCYLGEKISIVRKVPTADCYDPTNFKPKIESKPCPCTRDDYLCDFCYELRIAANGSQTCELDPACAGLTLYNPDDCRTVSRGYRIVPGDKCIGGLDLGHYNKCFPYFEVLSLTIFLGGCIVFSACFLGIFLYMHGTSQYKFQDFVEKTRNSLKGQPSRSKPRVEPLLEDDDDMELQSHPAWTTDDELQQQKTIDDFLKDDILDTPQSGTKTLQPSTAPTTPSSPPPVSTNPSPTDLLV